MDVSGCLRDVEPRTLPLPRVNGATRKRGSPLRPLGGRERGRSGTQRRQSGQRKEPLLGISLLQFLSERLPKFPVNLGGSMLGQQAVGIAQIARETGLTRHTVYRIKDDPTGAEGALVVWGL